MATRRNRIYFLQPSMTIREKHFHWAICVEAEKIGYFFTSTRFVLVWYIFKEFWWFAMSIFPYNIGGFLSFCFVKSKRNFFYHWYMLWTREIGGCDIALNLWWHWFICANIFGSLNVCVKIFNGHFNSKETTNVMIFFKHSLFSLDI